MLGWLIYLVTDRQWQADTYNSVLYGKDFTPADIVNTEHQQLMRRIGVTSAPLFHWLARGAVNTELVDQWECLSTLWFLFTATFGKESTEDGNERREKQHKHIKNTKYEQKLSEHKKNRNITKGNMILCASRIIFL